MLASSQLDPLLVCDLKFMALQQAHGGQMTVLFYKPTTGASMTSYPHVL